MSAPAPPRHRTDIRMRFGDTDALAADVRSVVVHFDYATRKSQPLTGDMRDRLAPSVKPA